MSRSTKIVALVVFILILDQTLKIWVKTNMVYGQEIFLLGLDWARLHFVENNGMAFGISLGGNYGKLALSLFRIIAVSALIYWIRLLIKSKAPFSFICSIAFILAGAIGNIIDSAFYGLIFSDSYHGGLAEMFPEEGGYAGFLHGRVVDMLYFPLIQGYFPSWVPFWGGDSFLFFRPVFNLADSAITIGVVSIIIWHRNFFSDNALEGPSVVDATTAESGEEPATPNPLQTATDTTTTNNTTSPINPHNLEEKTTGDGSVPPL